MCITCGCGGEAVDESGNAGAGGHAHSHPYVRIARRASRGAARTPAAAPENALPDAAPTTLQTPAMAEAACLAVPDGAPARRLRIERDILAKNAAYARINRRQLHAQGIFALNLVSSPGSGKTTLLCKTIACLALTHPALPLAVIEGDQHSSRDAERIRATGAPAVQINTGKGCHLDARMTGRAMAQLALPDNGLLLIENVGNLVCPAAFDLGEAHKVVIFSVTEGEDKPLKYPDMFRAAQLMLLSKIDLLPHLQFDCAAAMAHARRVNPAIEILLLSAHSGEGMQAWLDWLLRGVGHAQAVAGTAPSPRRTTAADAVVMMP